MHLSLYKSKRLEEGFENIWVYSHFFHLHKCNRISATKLVQHVIQLPLIKWSSLADAKCNSCINACDLARRNRLGLRAYYYKFGLLEAHRTNRSITCVTCSLNFIEHRAQISFRHSATTFWLVFGRDGVVNRKCESFPNLTDQIKKTTHLPAKWSITDASSKTQFVPHCNHNRGHNQQSERNLHAVESWILR